MWALLGGDAVGADVAHRRRRQPRRHADRLHRLRLQRPGARADRRHQHHGRHRRRRLLLRLRVARRSVPRHDRPVGARCRTPGVQSQFIARSGGNRFQGEYHLDWYNNSLQGSNIPDEYIVPTAFNNSPIREHSNEITKYYDHDINVGGPIKKDKIWYFGTYRKQKNAVAQPNFTFDQTFDTKLWNPVAKGTYQMNQNNKFIGYYQWGQKEQPNRLPFVDLHLQRRPSRPTCRIRAAGSTRVSGTARSATSCIVEARYGDFGYYFPLTHQQPAISFFWHDNGALYLGRRAPEAAARSRPQAVQRRGHLLPRHRQGQPHLQDRRRTAPGDSRGKAIPRAAAARPALRRIEHIYANGVSSQVIFGLPTATCQVGSLGRARLLTSKSALDQVGLFLNDTWADRPRRRSTPASATTATTAGTPEQQQLARDDRPRLGRSAARSRRRISSRGTSSRRASA